MSRTFYLLTFLTTTTTALAQVVTLDQVDVVSEKEKAFSLPLDAAPATGSRLGLANRDLPASVSIITQEVMQFRGLRTAVEAVEASVGMTGGTQFGSIPNYSTRGFGGNNVTILRDGIRQNTASQSSRTIDTFLLDRVEVLKGPSSLMFGEGAVGGAVNYVSKTPDRTFRGEAFGSIGPWDSYRFGVGVGGPLAGDTLAYRADVSVNSTGGYQDRNQQDYFGFAGALSWKPTSRLTLTAFTTWLEDSVESYYGNPVIYDAVVNTTVANAQPEVRNFVSATDRMINPRVDPTARRTNYNILDNYADTENSFHRLRADLTLSPNLEVRSESYVATQLLKWRNLESNLWNPVSRLVTRSSFLHIYRDDVLVGNRTDLTWKGEPLGRRTRVLVGESFERNDQVRGGTPGGVPTTLSSVSLVNPDVGYGPAARFQKTSRIVVETHAFFAEATMDAAPGVKVVGGLRYDHIALQRDTLFNPTVTPATAFATFKKGYRPWTGRLGVVYEINRSLNAYASISTAAEPVSQLVGLNSTQADFSLQKGRQIELGLKGSLADGRVDFTLAVFDIEKNDLLTSTLDAVTGIRTSQQIGAQRSQGVEAAVALSPAEGWRVEGNVAFTDAEYDDFNENLGTGVISRKGKRPSNVPEWVANVFVSKRLASGLALSGGPRYVSDRFGNTNNSVVAQSYTTVDVSASYPWKRWIFTLRGRNLLDEDYEPVAGTTMRRLADPLSAEFSAKVHF
ncbi:MAG: TonB-dependent receptor [Opitutaceae bacterium]|nr:TonB-dependent receptor [Opitutaceae bacterium]